MSSYDTWLNVLTGISQGSLDKIYLRDASGNMVDLLTLRYPLWWELNEYCGN